MEKTVQPKWYMGIGALCLTLLFFIFVAAEVELRLGMWGMIITELVILAVALLPIIIFKWKLSEVMPVKRPKLRQLAGVILMYIAGYIVVLAVTITTSYFFPQLIETSEGLNEFIVGAPFIVSFIGMSIMPGICEEALHRGLILHTLPKFRNQIITMLIMAVLFGIFHLDVYRFLPTAIIGFILTYIMIKTENILLPMFYHALNNGVIAIVSHSTNQDAAAGGGQVAVIPEAIGVYLIVAAITPGLFYAAGRLISNAENRRCEAESCEVAPNRPNKKAKYAAIIVTIALLVGGCGIIGVTAARSAMPVVSLSTTASINKDIGQTVYDGIIIEEQKTYHISISFSPSEKSDVLIGEDEVSISAPSDEDNVTLVTAELISENGETVFTSGTFGASGNMKVNGQLILEPGEYKLVLTYDCADDEETSIDMEFEVK